MSFRKRNAPLNNPTARIPGVPANLVPAIDDSAATLPGIRPSPVDGRLTTSTGTASLDGLLAGHAGLALGNSLLIEENGTTDYAGSLLRFFAAEGVMQGHHVHVVGTGEYWGRELPGVVDADSESKGKQVKEEKDKMKIAWRYEGLGEFGAGSAPRVPSKSAAESNTTSSFTFCHTFDLMKRLTLPSPKTITYLPIGVQQPFEAVIQGLSRELYNTSPQIIHRLILPNILSPASYPQSATNPSVILQFLHRLRAILRQYANRLVVMTSLPLMLFPRSSGLTRWIELLSDGVFELVPFPHTVDTGPPLSASSNGIAQEEKPQGMVRIHRLPVFHERGGGGLGSAGVGDDLAFTLSRRRFVVKPFSLPPIEGDQEAQHGEAEGGKVKVDIDF